MIVLVLLFAGGTLFWAGSPSFVKSRVTNGDPSLIFQYEQQDPKMLLFNRTVEEKKLLSRLNQKTLAGLERMKDRRRLILLELELGRAGEAKRQADIYKDEIGGLVELDALQKSEFSNQLGSLYISVGEFTKAIDVYEAALRSLTNEESQPERIARARILNNLAVARFLLAEASADNDGWQLNFDRAGDELSKSLNDVGAGSQLAGRANQVHTIASQNAKVLDEEKTFKHWSGREASKPGI